MKSTSKADVLAVILFTLSGSVLAGPFASGNSGRAGAGSFYAPAAAQANVRFTLERSIESPSDFYLLLAQGDESVISGMFVLTQLAAFRDLMQEASKFAFSEEGVGKDAPVVTRFSKKEERAFLIDVSKQGNQSQFFVTITTPVGKGTVDAGRINRTEKRQEGLFFEMLRRTQAEIVRASGSRAR